MKYLKLNNYRVYLEYRVLYLQSMLIEKFEFETYKKLLVTEAKLRSIYTFLQKKGA